MSQWSGRAWMVACVIALHASAGWAQTLAGTRKVVLANQQGERIAIGSVRFEPAGEGQWRFEVQLDEARFEERFLAMRPFRCLTGATQQLCHFPYAVDRVITRDDLVPLEYALMFLHKKPASVNVNSANGVYYRLGWAAGGDSAILRGRLYDVDMEPIIVPEGDMRRPIQSRHLQSADESSHWLPRLSIE